MFEFCISPASPSVDTLGLFEQITSLSVARSLDVPTVGPAGRVPNYALIQAETQNVRYREDGVAPTAGIGLLLIAGQPPTKFAGALNLLRFIEATSGAKLNITYH